MITELLDAIDAALAGDWDHAHRIVQQLETDPHACWLHAVLHKIEGDKSNSRYWYARTSHTYDEYSDPRRELAVIKSETKGR